MSVFLSPATRFKRDKLGLTPGQSSAGGPEGFFEQLLRSGWQIDGLSGNHNSENAWLGVSYFLK